MFFQRSNIASLHLYRLKGADKTQLTSCFDCIPDLQVLRLDLSGDLYCDSIRALMTTPRNHPNQVRYPNLRKLHLEKTVLYPEGQQLVEEFVESHSLDEIEVQCNLITNYREGERWRPID